MKPSGTLNVRVSSLTSPAKDAPGFPAERSKRVANMGIEREYNNRFMR